MRRKQFVKLVEDVKGYGGEVLIFSSMHESGQRESPSPLPGSHTDDDGTELNQLTGMAAILTYPLDVEDVEEEERILAADLTEDAAVEV